MLMPVIRVDFDSCEMTLEKPTQQLVDAAKNAINSVYGLMAAEQKIAKRGIDLADSTDSLEQSVVKQFINEMTENVKGDPQFMPNRENDRAFHQYLIWDDALTRKLYDKIQKEKNKAIYDNMIQRVIFNPPATIVIWRDGSKTVVKCGEHDIFDPEKGLAMAISKRAFGDNRDYYEIFAKWVGKYEYQQKKREKKP